MSCSGLLSCTSCFQSFFFHSIGRWVFTRLQVRKKEIKRKSNVKKKSQVFAPVTITTMSYWNSTVQQLRHVRIQTMLRLFFTDGTFAKLVQSEIRLSFTTKTYQQLWSSSFETFPHEI